MPIHPLGASRSSESSSPTAEERRQQRYNALSTPGSSPSEPSQPASLNGDDARHGTTSPATSVDGASAPPSGLKLDIGSSTAQSRHDQQASLNRAGVARSPHPLDGSSEARASMAARSGGILATMHEEDSAFEPTLSYDHPNKYAHMEQALRASRHRSASSAAALALHGNSSSLVDRWASNAAGRIASASNNSSRAVWDGHNAEADSSSMSQRPRFPQLQRGFSASVVRSKQDAASPSPFLSSPVGFHDLGFDFSEDALGASRSNANSTSSPFGAVSDLSEMSSYPDSVGVQETQRPAPGSESRRHSINVAALNRDSAGVIGGHRRSIGFDMTDPQGDGSSSHDPSHQTSASNGGWPQASAYRRDRSATSATPGFNPFAGGSLALTMDDLASDLDLDPSARHDSRRDTRATSNPSTDQSRVPTSSSADAGNHAASVPSAFDDQRLGNFRAGSMGFTDAQRTNRGGLDSLSASWDTMTPSQMTMRSSGGDGQRTLAEMTRQLRQMSMTESDSRGRPQPLGIPSIFDSLGEGTRTVRGSPNSSMSMRNTSGAGAGTGHGLSAQAKSFIASQPIPSMAQDQIGNSTGMGPGGLPGFGFLPPSTAQSSRLGQQMPMLPPFALPQQLSYGAAAAAMGLPGLGPGLTLNDLTFSSLAALGPMPPSSMGPPRGIGGFGGPPFGTGTTDALQDLGKGVPLASLSKDTPLYIVEFKQGRTDLFFRSTSPSQSPSIRGENDVIRQGDLVIVEADRGKDLGTVVNDSITVEQVQAFLAHQSDLTIGTAGGVGAAGLLGPGGLSGGASGNSGGGDETASNGSGRSGSPSSMMGRSTTLASASTGSVAMGARPMRTINPKRLFTKATAADTSTLFSKAQDEERALQLCISKVMQRGLPMSVVAAEMQWDRRKLTFYYTASMRVDFRDLVKELFRLYKTRIWMCHLGHPSGAGMG